MIQGILNVTGTRAYDGLPQQGTLLKLVPPTRTLTTTAPTRELDVANTRASYGDLPVYLGVTLCWNSSATWFLVQEKGRIDEYHV